VDLVETDVRFQDGEIVVRHERRPLPLPLLVDEKTSLNIGGEHMWRLILGRWYIALEDKPLALEEVLVRAKDERGLLLDLKGEYGGREWRLARALAKMLGRMDIKEEQATFCGQNWPLLEYLRAATPHLRAYYSIEYNEQLEAFQTMLKSEPIRGVCLNHSLIERPLIERFKDLEMTIYAWTVDDLQRAQELLEMGVDGIISNSLELLGLLSASPRGERQA
jgi:glycerophosphoryl diester phosphodiesterase